MSTIEIKKGRTIKVVTAAEHEQNISKRDIAMDRRAEHAVKVAIEKAKVCNKPIAKYDVETRRAYIEYANGERKYVQ